MSHTLYKIHRGISQPITFKGLQGQYIGYLAVGMLGLLLLFSLLYLAGLQPFICVGLALGGGTGLFLLLSSLSSRYGAHGWMKKMACKRIPRVIQGGPGRLSATLILIHFPQYQDSWETSPPAPPPPLPNTQHP